MAQIVSNLAEERSRGFVGRVEERGRIAGWVRLGAASTKTVAVTGLGGIGKSTFLAIALKDAERLGARTAWIDGRTVFGSTRAFQQAVPRDFRRWLREPDDCQKWILGIDNYESLHDLDGWLRHDFLARAPVMNLLVLVCARQFPLADWTLDLGWTNRVEQWPLAPFTVAEVAQFLARRGISAEAALLPGARVPLLTALYADCDRRMAGAAGIARAREAFSASLLREVADDVCQQAIDILCFVTAADLDFLNAAMDRPMRVADYRRLGSLSFITHATEGVGLHDLAAAELRRDFRRRQPGRFRRQRARVMACLWHSWKQADDQARGRIAHDFVQLVGQELAQWNDYADVSEDAPGLEVCPYEPADAADAVACLTDWGRPAVPMPLVRQEALFYAVAKTLPEAIRVLRDPSGRVVGVFAIPPLNQTSVPLLERAAADLLQRLFDHPALGLGRGTRAADDDTRLVAMVGMRTTHPLFPIPLLAGTILRHTLELSSGHRVLGLVMDERFKLLLERLGFVPHPFPTQEIPGLVLVVLDLRLENIPSWAARLTDTPLWSDGQQELRDLPFRDCRRLLRCYHDNARLGQLLRETGLSLSADQLREMLTKALGDFAQKPGAARWAELIRQSYLELDSSGKTREGIANSLHVSRATYHRHLQSACEEFFRFLSKT